MESAAPQAPLAEQLTLDDMLERFVLNTSGPQVIDLWAPQRRMRPHEFRQHYASSVVVEGKRVVPVAVKWLQHSARLTVDAATFDPAQKKFFSDGGRTFFNTWAPPQWPQTDLDHAAPFVDHMHYLVPNEGERSDFLDIIAHAAQQPGR